MGLSKLLLRLNIPTPQNVIQDLSRPRLNSKDELRLKVHHNELRRACRDILHMVRSWLYIWLLICGDNCRCYTVGYLP